MGIVVKKGELILGEYEVTTQLKEDSVYQWVKAINRRNGETKILQLLILDINQDIASLFDYFGALSVVRRKELIVPERVFSDANYPLVVTYSDMPSQPFTAGLNQTPERTIELLYEASEALFTLHNKPLIHGCVTPDCFFLVNGAVYLTGFGYAPLLQMGYREAIREGGDFLAPEVLKNHSVTSAADVYAFAKTVVSWLPNLTTTQWYYQATNLNPNDRFKRMPNLFDALKKALASLSAPERTGQEKPDEKIPPENKTESIPEKKNKGGLIPLYVLELKAEPLEGGSIEGGGSYRAEQQVTIKAIPSVGWQFKGWSQDLSGSENPLSLSMEANYKVIAQFIKLPQAVLSVSVEPSEAGSIRGGGNYTVGTQVQVQACVTSGKWHFERWSGAINGSTNPATLIVDRDKSAIAHFVKVNGQSPQDGTQNKRSVGKAFASDERQSTSETTNPSTSLESPQDDIQNKRSVGKAFASDERQSTSETTNPSTSLESPQDGTQNKRSVGKAFE